ncbi:hypothetical protein GCM10010294_43540 [Streptomyces griseoloalbus]|uniref:hypothetical protein n=1 Tax=Streptomyces griseoloalbus TaxID=67303 RepID=UPI00187428E9|nr:hypothetical protein GCM10010294_43540 [Streptomyces griseoloalbus]
MGRGEGGRRSDLHTAAALGAGQLPAAGLLWWIIADSGTDDYGAGYGGAFGLLCVLLFAPLVLPCLGLLHAVLHPLPALALARRAARHVRGPEWARHLGGVVLLGTAWAAPVTLLWGGSFPATALALSLLGVLPVLGIASGRGRTRRTGRAWGTWGIWLGAAPVSAALFVAAFLGALLASFTGVLAEYEPPKLSAGQLAGVWRGDDGAVLRLLPGGRAESTALPARGAFDDAPDAEDFVVCEGSGTWSPDTPDRAGERDGVLLSLDGDCGRETVWTIGGTADDPELFVLFGDPDAGDLRVLTRS